MKRQALGTRTSADEQIVLNLSRVAAQGTGQSVFSRQVLKCLTEHFNDIWIVAGENIEVPSGSAVVRVPSWVTMSHGLSKIRPILWLLYSHARLSRLKGRVFSTTAHPLPGLRNQIVCVLDLRTYLHPDGILQRIYSRLLLRRRLSSAASIVTISAESKRGIVEAYGFPAERIHVVPLIVDVSQFKPLQENRRCLSQPYLLMVGATWKHKNAVEVLENSSLWQHKYRLKVVAGDSPYRRALAKIVQERALSDKVEFISYVSQDELVSLYQNASALLYPSIMEGFGIPPLEAMAAGVPAIVSDIPVFREVYGDGALYAKLGDPASWKSALSELECAQTRRRLLEAGLRVSSSYTPDRMARALIAAVLTTWPETQRILKSNESAAFPLMTEEYRLAYSSRL